MPNAFVRKIINGIMNHQLNDALFLKFLPKFDGFNGQSVRLLVFHMIFETSESFSSKSLFCGSSDKVESILICSSKASFLSLSATSMFVLRKHGLKWNLKRQFRIIAQ